jgi:hypothetical protein
LIAIVDFEHGILNNNLVTEIDKRIQKHRRQIRPHAAQFTQWLHYFLQEIAQSRASLRDALAYFNGILFECDSEKNLRQ